MDKAERRLQVGGIQPGISSRKMLAGKGNWLEWHRETGGGWLRGEAGVLSLQTFVCLPLSLLPFCLNPVNGRMEIPAAAW